MATTWEPNHIVVNPTKAELATAYSDLGTSSERMDLLMGLAPIDPGGFWDGAAWQAAAYDGIEDDTAVFEAALTLAGSTGRAVKITRPLKLASSVTDSTAHVMCEPGGYIVIPTGVTLTIKYFSAGRQPCFVLSGTGSVVFTGGVEALPEWWGAVGDFDTDEQTGTDNLTALTAAFAAGKVIDLGGRSYGISDTLALTSDAVIISNGGSLHHIPTGSNTSYVLSVSGSRNGWNIIDSDANRGSNAIECAALAGSVSKGDLIKIVGDKTYRATESSYSKQGEQHSVLFTYGNYIYLSGTLQDTYTTGDNAQIAIVSPVHFETIGKLKIYQYPDPSEPGMTTQGVYFEYCENLSVDIECHECTDMSVTVADCYAPNVHLVSTNNYYKESGGSYGLYIKNTTMNGNFTGMVEGARHAVGVGSGNDGLSWNNRVSMVGYGVGPYAVFDAHGATGSILYDGCIAIGGSDVYNQLGGPYTPNGFQLGAVYNYIKNCVAINCLVVTAPRSYSPDIQVFSVDGLSIQGGGFVFLANPYDCEIQKLSLKNISGDCGVGVMLLAQEDSTTVVNEIEMENIHITDGNYLLFVDSIYNSEKNSSVIAPSTIVVNDSSVTDTDNTNSGIYIDGGSGSTETLILNNVGLHGQEWPIYLTGTGMTRVELNNVRSIGTNQTAHIRNKGDLTELAINGGYYADSITSLVRLYAADAVGDPPVSPPTALGSLVISGATIRSASAYVLVDCAATATLSAAFIGPNDMEYISIVSDAYTAGYLEVLGGGQLLPLCVRGSGSPESVLAAPVGSMFLRSDGGAGTSLYVKETGAGKTGWVAK